MCNEVSIVCCNTLIQIMKYLSYLDCSSDGIHPHELHMQCQSLSQSVSDSAVAAQAYSYASIDCRLASKFILTKILA